LLPGLFFLSLFLFLFFRRLVDFQVVILDPLVGTFAVNILFKFKPSLFFSGERDQDIFKTAERKTVPGNLFSRKWKGKTRLIV
jgi:hypothetical protein